MLGNLKPGKIWGWRGRFLKGQNQKIETGIKLVIWNSSGGKIVESNLMCKADLYYWNHCSHLILRKFLKYFPSWWKSRISFISVKLKRVKSMELLRWIVAMSELSVFSLDHAAQRPTGVYCSSWSCTSVSFQRQNFGQRGGAWAGHGQPWRQNATKVSAGDQDRRICCTCQDSICHAQLDWPYRVSFYLLCLGLPT